MHASRVLAWLLAAALVGSGRAAEVPSLPDGLYVTFDTARGAITAELFPDLVPLTVANLVGLAEGTIPFENRPAGQPFYDGLTFHRVVPGFVIQGGDPFANSQGDTGTKFADEFTPLLKHDAAGVLSMANGAPNDNSSQFFITLAPVNRLNYKHSVFGRVVRGLEVLPKIQPGDVMSRVAIVRIGEKAAGYHIDAERLASVQAQMQPIAPRDPALPPLYLNEAGVETRPGYDSWINEKLHHYAVVTGVTIHVRLLPKFATPLERTANANPLRSLHVAVAANNPKSATIVFLANDKRWRLWLADGLLPRFGLTPGAVGEGAGAQLLHDLKQTILADAKTLWDSADEPRHRAIDAAITNLIEALDRPDMELQGKSISLSGPSL